MGSLKERSYYVETSVWGMLPKGQPREMRRSSLQFLRRLTGQNCFLSAVMLKEIMAAEEADRVQIVEAIERVQPIIANVRKSEQYRGANLLRGHIHTPLILTPLEVIYE
jgi:hypothetical protein